MISGLAMLRSKLDPSRRRFVLHERHGPTESDVLRRAPVQLQLEEQQRNREGNKEARKFDENRRRQPTAATARCRAF